MVEPLQISEPKQIQIPEEVEEDPVRSYPLLDHPQVNAL
jgi:hypothetical protein